MGACGSKSSKNTHSNSAAHNHEKKPEFDQHSPPKRVASEIIDANETKKAHPQNPIHQDIHKEPSNPEKKPLVSNNDQHNAENNSSLLKNQNKKSDKYSSQKENKNNAGFELAPTYFIEDADENIVSHHQVVLETNEDAQNKTRRKGDLKKKKVGTMPDMDEIVENVHKIPDKEITNKDVSYIVSILKNHFVFHSMNEQQTEDIVKKMFYCSAYENTYIFQQGDENATCFFILESGNVAVEINGELKRKLQPKETFGELALLYSAPRSASIKAQTTSYFWGIDRKTFKETLEKITNLHFKERRQFIDSIQFFSLMTSAQKDSIANCLSAQKFDKGQDIVRMGDQANSYYIIKDGEVSCIKNEEEIRRLCKGDAFGEQALYMNSNRALTVRAATTTTVLALGREELTKILGGKVQQIVYKNSQRWAFEKHHLLGLLTKMQTEKVIDSATYKNVKEKENIIVEKSSISNIIILIEGTAIEKIKKPSEEDSDDEANFETKEYAKGSLLCGDYFETNNKHYKTTFSMATNGVISIISLDRFHQIIGGLLPDVIKRNEHSHEKQLFNNDMTWKKSVEALTIEDLIFIKTLGKGQFGNVYLVKDPNNKNRYALKVVSKPRIVNENLQAHIIAEKRVLEMINYSLIVSMFRTFKDENNIYFLLGYVEGMELFEVIREIGYLNNSQSKFYIASMILAIEYLHFKNIIYRDLKPENIMIDCQGYLRLIDLGTAKILKPANGISKTTTLLGTPHYMAPEMFEKKGYSFYVDLWSIGVCLYEFMIGYLPFGDDCEDPFEVYNEIVSNSLKFPKMFLKNENKDAQSMMEMLLDKAPERRLKGSYSVLKTHKWFENFDFDALYDRNFSGVPFMPKSVINDKVLEAAQKENKKVINEIAKLDKPKSKASKYSKNSNIHWDAEF